MFSRISSRSYATSSSSFKLVTKEFESPVSKLQVIVKNAGAKNNDKSGLSHLLANFSFLNTNSKSGLRLKRESELLGGVYQAKLTRDDLVLEAQFLKEDLPYYLNAIGSTLSEAAFKEHEFEELVLPATFSEYALVSKNSKIQSLEKLHELSFRKGLGNSLYYDGISKITLEDLKSYKSKYVNKQNLEIHSFGVVEKDLVNFIETSSFSLLPEGSAVSSAQVKTFVGEQSRVRLPSSKSTASFGIPIAKGEEATFAALSALINSKFPTSLALEVETKIANYSGASLFYVSLTSNDSLILSGSIKAVAKELKNAKGLSKLSKAAELENPSLDVKSIKDSVKFDKFNYVVVGNVDGLPYAEEL